MKGSVVHAAPPAVSMTAAVLRTAPTITLVTLLGAAMMLLVSGLAIVTDGQFLPAATVGLYGG